MKKDTHPENYRFIVFKDMSNGYEFLSRSCAETSETTTYEDGNEYPLIKLEISYKSHPFYTGKLNLVDTAGRIDKFKNRYKRHITPTSATKEVTGEESKEETKEN